MAFKHLAFLAVIKLVLSVSDPEPDPDVNIDVKQVVNGDDGCGGNQCCPEREVDCDFSGQQFPHGSTQVLSCMKFKCVKGDWHYTGKVDIKNCGQCQVFGDPQFLTYDYHTQEGWNYTPNWYSYNKREGHFIVTQHELEDITALSVTSFFQSEKNDPAPYGYTIPRTVCYWELEITICVVFPSFELHQCYDSSNPGEYPECDIKVTVNGYPWIIGENIQVFNALAGNVLVFDHNHHGILVDPYLNNGTAADNSRCINIVGSMGLSVSFCTSYNNYIEAPYGGVGTVWSIYSHLYVWAMPHLQGQLYGLCDTYTGQTQNGYTMHNGTVTDGTGQYDIYDKIIDDFALTWMISGSSTDIPDLTRCLNATVYDEVKDECASITHDFCTAHPRKCYGFKKACEYDLCRVSDTDDYAQGYANHLKIETHLNQ